jgi:hypothetical protein
MPFSKLPHIFDNLDLTAMGAAYETACADLGIKATDTGRRERVAALIIELALSGERNSEVLHRRVMMLLAVSAE